MKWTSSTLIALTLNLLAATTTAFPLLPSSDQVILSSSSKINTSTPRPLVIWHGLGDTALSSGISSFIDDIKSLYPGIFVYSVQIPLGGSLDAERKAGFFGNAVEQSKDGCDQLSEIPELADGFDAMGFSQGGLFLRDYAQYCHGPPIRNLITFGTPHLGISALLPCPTPPTLQCILAARAARTGIYTIYAQTHLIQAQYFRDVERMEEFLERGVWLRDMNAEGKFLGGLQGESEDAEDGGTREEGEKEWREGGGSGLGELENMVAIMFDADRTVSPAQSAHFASNPYSPIPNKTEIIPIRNQTSYKEDWIGLRKLDERGGLQLEHCPGEHMDLAGGDCGMRIVRDWVGWDM